MRKHIWLLSGLLVVAAAAPSRADFTVRLGGDPAADVPFQTLVDRGDATVDPVHRWGYGARIAVGSVRFGLGVGARAVGYRPYYWGGYRPYHYGGYRPYYWAGYRPWYGYRSYYGGYRPYYYGGGYGGYYSSYYYPSYYYPSYYNYPSYSYYDPYYYGCNGSYAPTANAYAAPAPSGYSAPVMPSAPDGDGTYPYDGGPRTLPYSAPQPAPTTEPRPTVPREGKIVLLTASSPAPIYPAYGEQPAAPRTTSSTIPVRLTSQPARISYPAYGESQPVQTLVVRGGAE